MMCLKTILTSTFAGRTESAGADLFGMRLNKKRMGHWCSNLNASITEIRFALAATGCNLSHVDVRMTGLPLSPHAALKTVQNKG